MGDLWFKVRVLRMFVAGAFDQWKDEIWRREVDQPYCCDGRECGCGAMTVRECYGYYLDKSNG